MDRIIRLRLRLSGVPFLVRRKSTLPDVSIYVDYLNVCIAYRDYLKRVKVRPPTPFYRVDNSLINRFRDRGVRRTIKLETRYYLLGEADKLPLDLRYRLSLEDFCVHLRIFGDTFSKDTQTIERELKSVSDSQYFEIIDSIFYKDYLVTYMYRVRRRLLIYLKKGSIYTVSRVTHRLLNRLQVIPKKYFTLREQKVIDYPGEICLIRDRVRFFKDYYE